MQRIPVSILAAVVVGIVGTSAASAQTYPYGTSTTPYAGSGSAYPTNGFTSSYSSYGYNAYPGYGSSGVYGSYNTGQYGQPYNGSYSYGQPSSYGYSTPGYGYTGSYNSYPSTYNSYPTTYGTQSYYGGSYPGSYSTPYGGPPGTYGMGSGVYGYNGTPPNYSSNTYGYPPAYNSTTPGAYNYGAPGYPPPGYNNNNVSYSQSPTTGTTSNGTNYVLGQYYYGAGVPQSTPYTGQQNFQITPYNQGALGQYLTGYNVPMQGGTPMPMFQQPTSGY